MAVILNAYPPCSRISHERRLEMCSLGIREPEKQPSHQHYHFQTSAMATFLAILPFLLSLHPLLSSAAPRDTLLLGSSLSVDKYQTDILRSRDGTFTCGFNSIYTNAFTFSIWYTHSSKTVVWTANRGRPVHARGHGSHPEERQRPGPHGLRWCGGMAGPR